MQHVDVNFDSGGLQCVATVYRPSGATGVVGCVVMGNGITLTRNDGIPDYAQRFAGAGFAVLAFDYRHWGDSGGEPRRLVSLRRSSRTGRPPCNTPAGSRVSIPNESRSGVCRWAADTRS
jgi:dienelactone hydrolase